MGLPENHFQSVAKIVLPISSSRDLNDLSHSASHVHQRLFDPTPDHGFVRATEPKQTLTGRLPPTRTSTLHRLFPRVPPTFRSSPWCCCRRAGRRQDAMATDRRSPHRTIARRTTSENGRSLWRREWISSTVERRKFYRHSDVDGRIDRPERYVHANPHAERWRWQQR